MQIEIQKIKEISKTLFHKVGLSNEDAEIITNVLTETEMRGVFTHGFIRLSRYINCILSTYRLIFYRLGKIAVVVDGAVVNLRAVDFDDAVTDGIHQFLIVAGHEKTALEVFQPVVEGGDRFEVEMVGGLV